MLSIDQVKPYLTSSHKDIRELAEYYFETRHFPLLTADEWWLAFETNNNIPNWLHHHPVMDSTQSPASVKRLIDLTNNAFRQIKVMGQPERPLINFLPLATLREFSELILSTLKSSFYRDAVRERLALYDRSPEELWSALNTLSEDYRGLAYSELPITLPDLEDALTTHPDFTLGRAIELTEAVIKDAETRYDGWMPVFVVTLLGKLRHSPSVARLITLLNLLDDPVNDSLCTEALQSLVRIGGQDVLDAVEASHTHRSAQWVGDMSTDLAELNSPAVEELLTRLLEKETDDNTCTSLALSLMSLCPTNPPALEAIRKLVVEDRWNTVFDDPLRTILPLCEITGWSPPELEHWRSIYDTPERNAQLKARFEHLFTKGDPETQRMLDEIREHLNVEGILNEPEDDPVQIRDLPPSTFIRAEPKVGRNDPCPCGSGKKYKKCCGK